MDAVDDLDVATVVATGQMANLLEVPIPWTRSA
jgi:hypothetical protein